jgi:hypothetical protein
MPKTYHNNYFRRKVVKLPKVVTMTLTPELSTDFSFDLECGVYH